MQAYAIHKPTEVDAADEAFDKVSQLKIGESIAFMPPLPREVTSILFALLRRVDKGWEIKAGPEAETGWWKGLVAGFKVPVDLRGRPIPQTIAEMKRKR